MYSLNISLLGTLSGTFLNPSISSENAINFVGQLTIAISAFLTMVVLTTSPNVPMCGNPDGPYPVSKSI